MTAATDPEGFARRQRRDGRWLMALMLVVVALVGLRWALRLWTPESDRFESAVTADLYARYAAFAVHALLLAGIVSFLRGHTGKVRAVLLAAAVVFVAVLGLELFIIHHTRLLVASLTHTGPDLDYVSMTSLSRAIEAVGDCYVGVLVLGDTLVAVSFVVAAAGLRPVERTRWAGLVLGTVALARFGLYEYLQSADLGGAGPQARALLYVGQLGLDAALPLATLVYIAIHDALRFPLAGRFDADDAEWPRIAEGLRAHAGAVVLAKLVGIALVGAVVMASSRGAIVFAQLVSWCLGLWVLVTAFRIASVSGTFGQAAERGAMILAFGFVAETLGMLLTFYALGTESLSLLMDLPDYLGIASTVTIGASMIGAASLCTTYEGLATAGRVPVLARRAGRVRVLLLVAGVAWMPSAFGLEDEFGNLAPFHGLLMGMLALTVMALYLWTVWGLAAVVEATTGTHTGSSTDRDAESA